MSDAPVKSRAVTVKNPSGLHLRPWYMVVKLVQPYKSKIEVVKEFVRVDARSVLQLMTLGVKQGETIVVEAEGDDAESAVAALAEFLDGYVEEQEA
jgi:phosphocarrier protein HPr